MCMLLDKHHLAHQPHLLHVWHQVVRGSDWVLADLAWIM